MECLSLLVVSLCAIVSTTFSLEEYLHKNDNHDSALLQTLTSYEVVEPVQFEDFQHKRKKRDLSTEIQTKSGFHVRKAYFTIDFEGKTLMLDVSINEELVPESFHVTTYSESGDLIMHKSSKKEQNHCYYKGHVRGIPGSQVIMSTCHGLKGSVFLPNDLFVFEPSFNATISPAKYNQYVVYRPKDVKGNKLEGTCRNDGLPKEKIQSPLLYSLNQQTELLSKKASKKKRDISSEKKFLELMLVVDNALATRLGSQSDIEDHVKQLGNHLDGFYEKLGIRIVLSGIEVWSQADRVAISSDASEALSQFLAYRKDRVVNESSSSPWVYADNVHLLYGSSFDGTTIGLATVGSMCTMRSGAVDEDTSNNLITTAATIAHEIGHNFGLVHDSDGCVCPAGAKCIMAASSGFSSVRDWSDCSKGYLDQSEKLGLLNCLVNVPLPSRMFGGSECGNDIVEEDEECDCGTPEFCKSTCCDAATCKLKSGAVCDAGLCCNNCQYVASGAECRGANSNECDLPEYCSGTSANCPNNVYLENGSPCLNDGATCSGGICLTYDVQCQTIWGPTAKSSGDICYGVVNGFGNKNGNCGLKSDGSGFLACTEANSKCGKLLCSEGSTSPVIGGQRSSFLNTLTVSGTKYQCKTIPSDESPSDEQDPGLVQSGTKCHAGKVCQSGVCKEFQALDCSSSCNGNGVCNNLEHCHCNDGFAPPNCEDPGNGGSVDSGPRTGGASNYFIPMVASAGGVVLVVGGAFALHLHGRRRPVSLPRP